MAYTVFGTGLPFHECENRRGVSRTTPLINEISTIFILVLNQKSPIDAREIFEELLDLLEVFLNFFRSAFQA
jgi:hypothetical protein